MTISVDWKFWAILAAIIALVIGLAVLVVHEREIGKQEVATANARAEANALVHDAEVQSRAQALTDQALSVYRGELAAAPDVSAPPVWVSKPAACSRDVPDHAAPGPAPDAGAALSITVPQPRDVGPQDDKLHADADAQVAALQAYIKACQDAGICSK